MGDLASSLHALQLSSQNYENSLPPAPGIRSRQLDGEMEQDTRMDGPVQGSQEMEVDSGEDEGELRLHDFEAQVAAAQ